MLRLLIFLVGMLSTRRPGAVSWRPARDHDDPDEDGTWYLPPRPDLPLQPTRESRTMPFRPERVRRRPRIPRKLKWAALLILAGLIFRKAIAWAVLTALGATLHLVGINVHLPHVRFGWPWQSISAGTTTDTSIGIWPCWYSATFATVGHASATVDLNPGPAWWTPATGHYRLQILSRPAGGVPGRVSVAIVLPRPQLPQSV